jgi:hypothetical protein
MCILLFEEEEEEEEEGKKWNNFDMIILPISYVIKTNRD